MTVRRLGSILALSSCLAAGPAFARTGEGTLRISLSHVSPGGATSASQSGAFVAEETYEPASGLGLGVAYEYRATDVLGVDFGLFAAELDLDYAGSNSTGTTTVSRTAQTSIMMLPLTFGLNLHPFSGDRVDVHFGVVAAYVFYGNLEISGGNVTTTADGVPTPISAPGAIDVGVDGDFGFGARLGVDVPLGTGDWGISVRAEYLRTRASFNSVGVLDHFDLDPWILAVGAYCKY